MMKTTTRNTRKSHTWAALALACALMMATTVDAQTSSWLLTGNSDATSSSFVGTTNSVPLLFGTNNTIRMALLANNPFLGIGTSAPMANLHIHGSHMSNPKPAPTTFQITNPSTGSSFSDGFKIYLSSLAVTISQLEKANLSVLNNGQGLVIDTNGYVGFNTQYPKQKIHVVDNNILITKTSSRAPGSTNGSILFGSAASNTDPAGSWGIEYCNSESEGYGLNFWKTWETGYNGFNHALFLSNDGNVGIGTNTPQEKLTVNGTVCAKEVRVSLNGSPCWPDYVFGKEYELMNLKDLGNFVRKNNHLPNIPSAAEVQESGIELGEMNALLLQKIEELTLYVIDLQQQIDELKGEGGLK